MLDIEQGLDDHNLSFRLHQLKSVYKENAVLDILIMLLREEKLTSVTPFESLNINKVEVESIKIEEITNNTELLARWYDLLQYLKIDVKNSSFKAYDFYIQLYTESKKWKYALRAFLIVKLKKGLFKNRLKNITVDFCNVLSELKYPYPYKIITSIIVSFTNKETLSDIERDVNSKLQNCVDERRYSDAIHYVESLYLIGKINTKELKKRKSKIFEQDADDTVENKKTNTYYPDIVSNYQYALREISDLEGVEKDKKRISEKLIREQKEFAEGLQFLSECSYPKIDLAKIYEEIVINCKADNPLTVFRIMISFPIMNGKWITRQVANTKKNHPFLLESFNEYLWLNSKGATININAGDNAIEDSVRRTGQLLMIEYLKIFIGIINSFDDCDIDEYYIYKHLTKLNSKFIPLDRIHLFAQGLWLGFKGDFSLASQILLPQIENGFRFIAQQQEITTTQLAKPIQNENTMGGVLEKIHLTTDPDVWDELNHFLIEGVNFRNQAMHGLLSHGQLHHYGIYLWWLCIKIIYNTDNYFGFKKNQ